MPLYLTNFIASSTPSPTVVPSRLTVGTYAYFTGRLRVPTHSGSYKSCRHWRIPSYSFLLPLYSYSVTRILPEPRLLQINVVNLTELTVNTQRPTARVTQVLSNPFQAQNRYLFQYPNKYFNRAKKLKYSNALLKDLLR